MAHGTRSSGGWLWAANSRNVCLGVQSWCKVDGGLRLLCTGPSYMQDSYAGLRRRQAAGRMNAGVVGVKGEDALHITFNSRQGEIKGKQSCHTVAADATTMAPPQPISPVCDGSSLDSGQSNFWDWKSSPHGWRWSRGAQPQQGSIVFGTSEHDETMDSLVAHARARHQGDLARAPTGLLITEHCA